MYKIIKVNEEKFNEKTEECLKNGYAISNKQVCIAALSDRVFTLLFHSNNIDELLVATHDRMHEALANMPDFAYNPIPEWGKALIYLNNGFICTLLSKEEAKWGEKIPEEDYGELLSYRQMCLDACEKGEVIGFLIPDIETNSDK